MSTETDEQEKLVEKVWVRKLISAFVQGFATAGATALGSLAIGDNMANSLKHAGASALIRGLLNVFTFLEKTPTPFDANTDFIKKNVSILFISFGVGFLCSCGSITTKKFDPTTGKLIEESRTHVFAQKSLLKGYKVFTETKSGTKSAVTIGSIENETQSEVITASGSALGNFAGAAIKAAAK